MSDLFRAGSALADLGVLAISWIVTVTVLAAWLRGWVVAPAQTRAAEVRALEAAAREAKALELAKAATDNAERTQEQAQKVLEIVERMEQRGRGRPY